MPPGRRSLRVAGPRGPIVTAIAGIVFAPIAFVVVVTRLSVSRLVRPPNNTFS